MIESIIEYPYNLLFSSYVIGLVISLICMKYIINEVESIGLEYQVENKLIAVTFIVLSFIWPLLIFSIIFVYIRGFWEYVN